MTGQSQKRTWAKHPLSVRFMWRICLSHDRQGNRQRYSGTRGKRIAKSPVRQHATAAQILSVGLRSSVLDGARQIVRYEGLRTLWRGTDAAVLMSVPLVAIYLPLYDFLLPHTATAGEPPPAAHHLRRSPAMAACTRR